MSLIFEPESVPVGEYLLLTCSIRSALYSSAGLELSLAGLPVRSQCARGHRDHKCPCSGGGWPSLNHVQYQWVNTLLHVPFSIRFRFLQRRSRVVTCWVIGSFSVPIVSLTVFLRGGANEPMF